MGKHLQKSAKDSTLEHPLCTLFAAWHAHRRCSRAAGEGGLW